MLEEMSSTKSAHLVEVVGVTQISTHGSTNMAVECLTDEEIISDLIEGLAERMGCKITVVNQPSSSPDSELVEDLLAVVHTFSCRLYGLRKYKTILRNESLTSDAD